MSDVSSPHGKPGRSRATAFLFRAAALPLVVTSACQPHRVRPQAISASSGTTRRGPPLDASIAQTIHRYLEEAHVLRGQSVQVEVSQGIANLDGTVSTLVARERAGAIAGTIRGVRSVVNRIAVDPPVRADDAIRSDVEQALHDELGEKRGAIGVAVKGGAVALTGETDSWRRRTLLGEVIFAVPGVRAVDNRITIHYAMVRPEVEIAGEVRQRIDDDAWLDGAAIAVKVQAQTVKLAGVVSSFSHKVRAGSDAWLAGVAAVDDGELVVDGPALDAQRRLTDFPFRSDAAVERAVRDAFKYDPRLGTPLPTVSVQNGTAVLSGRAEGARARRAAEEDAEGTVGVWGVRDEVVVASTPPPSDADVGRAVQRALSEDVFLAGAARIGVATSNGKVTLSGNVASGNERHDAVMDARAVPGVAEVDDQLALKLDPAEVARAIDDRLFWDAALPRDRVAVVVGPDGIATLTGELDSWAELKAASEDAWLGGARRVVNLVKLRGQPVLLRR